MIRYYCFLWIAVILTACSPKQRQMVSDADRVSDTIRYASGFSVVHADGYTAVDVRDPWDSTRLLQRYLLVKRGQVLPANMPAGTVVQTPVRNIVVYTSVHASIVDCLGETDRIIGICEPRFVDIPSIRQGLENGRIADMGEATAPNVEKMIEKGVELIIASPFQHGSYGSVGKLGLPIIEAADYMEALPLGRTEWIRFYGLLFEKEQLADSLFRTTEKRYLSLKKQVEESDSRRPSVFSEKRFGASWFMPAGESYMATFFRDAGADFLFSDLPGGGSIPLAFETVLERAIHADVWLLKYNKAEEMTYDELRTEYQPYENFDAFKNRHIYTCNTGAVPYYEDLPLHPDYLLEDLIRIFHPDVLPEQPLRYFRKMAE